jgi:hypothetical protein
MTLLNIATVAYNKPEFIGYQYRSFAKFIKNKFDYTVYDNAANALTKNEIHAVCNNLNIPVVSVPDNFGDDSNRAGSSLNYAIDDMRKKSNINVMLVDSDIFLTDYYDALESIGDYALLGNLNYRRGEKIECIFYYTNQFLQMNFSKLPVDKDFSFSPGSIDGVRVDCGGLLYNYFLKYPEIKHKGIKIINGTPTTIPEVERIAIQDCNKILLEFFKKERDIFKFENNSNFSELFQEVFVHLRAGSNWVGISAEKQKQREENLYNLINFLTL